MSAEAPDGPALVHWPGGQTWLTHPDAAMARASHALVADGAVWVVDPLEADGIHDAIAGLGDVAGVAVLLDRHERDAAGFADRYDVAVHVPDPLGDALDGLGVPVERFDGELAGSGYRARPVVRNRFWREAALVAEDAATAVVPEALGTATVYVAPGERVGVHPILRLGPPRGRLGDLDPRRLLVGHGRPVLAGAGAAVRDALAGARRRAPEVYWRAITSFVERRLGRRPSMTD